MPRRRTTLAVLAALAAALVATLSLPAIGNAQSRTNVVVGMGDQHVGIFSDPNYQALGVKRVRYFIRWDAIRNPSPSPRRTSTSSPRGPRARRC